MKRVQFSVQGPALVLPSLIFHSLIVVLPVVSTMSGEPVRILLICCMPLFLHLSHKLNDRFVLNPCCYLLSVLYRLMSIINEYFERIIKWCWRWVSLCLFNSLLVWSSLLFSVFLVLDDIFCYLYIPSL